MQPSPEGNPLEALREAIRLSPRNLPLRQHYGDMLLSSGHAAEAEQEFRQALTQWPEHPGLLSGLASAFYQQGKKSESLVILESLAQGEHPPAKALLLYARLLFLSGDTAPAVSAYQKAVEADPALADLELAARLGLTGQEEIVEGRQRASWEGTEAEPVVELERPRVNFADVGGMEALKEEIRLKIIYPLTHPEIYQAYGKAAGGGILLYGPPGCGKTHLARATAGEIEAGFIAVGINDVLDMWIGNSEKNLHELFERGRRGRPCVLFFDEVDALGANRGDLRKSGGRHLINQFLAEMDGIQSANEGLLLLAATNAPWHLDPAFRRPGRFDRILFVPPPDAEARASILRLLLRGKPSRELDYEAVARKTDAFSGADLKALVDVAIEGKLRDAMREGVPKPLGTLDLLAALPRVKRSTREWFSTARNYALYSNQGGVYDDILKYLKL